MRLLRVTLVPQLLKLSLCNMQNIFTSLKSTYTTTLFPRRVSTMQNEEAGNLIEYLPNLALKKETFFKRNLSHLRAVIHASPTRTMFSGQHTNYLE